MGQSTFTIDKKIFTSAGITTGATVTYDVACPTDQIMRVRAWVFISNASASHLNNKCAMAAEYVVGNSNGTTVAIAAMTNSFNPNNSGTTVATGFNGSTGVQAMDAGLGTPSASWTVSSPNARLTVTNISATTNITVYVETMSVGST